MSFSELDPAGTAMHTENQPTHQTRTQLEGPMATSPFVLFVCLHEDGIDVRGLHPHRVTPTDLERASRVVTFGCDLGDLAPPGLAIERWDDVPAVSEDSNKARDVIVAHLPRLLP